MLRGQVVLERLRDAGIIIGGMKVGQPVAVTCRQTAVCEALDTHRSLQQSSSVNRPETSELPHRCP